MRSQLVAVIAMSTLGACSKQSGSSLEAGGVVSTAITPPSPNGAATNPSDALVQEVVRDEVIAWHRTWVGYAGDGSLDGTIQFDGHVELVTDDRERIEATIDRSLVDAFTNAVGKAKQSTTCEHSLATEGLGTTEYTIRSSGKQTTLAQKDRGCFTIGGSIVDAPGLYGAEYHLAHELSLLVPPRKPKALAPPIPTAAIDWSTLSSTKEIRIEETYSSTLRYQTITTVLRRTTTGFDAEIVTAPAAKPEVKVARPIATKLVDDVLSGLSRSTEGSCKPEPWTEPGAFTATFTLTVPTAAPIQIVRRSRMCWKGNGRILSVDPTLGGATDRLVTALHAP